MARRKKRKPFGAIVDGTSYNDSTPSRVVDLLESSRKSGKRLCIRYGDRTTGREWDERRMCGRIGRSTGTIKIPLLIKTRRSMGGEGVLDDAIVKIYEPTTKQTLYVHPKYHL